MKRFLRNPKLGMILPMVAVYGLFSCAKVPQEEGFETTIIDGEDEKTNPSETNSYVSDDVVINLNPGSNQNQDDGSGDDQEDPGTGGNENENENENEDVPPQPTTNYPNYGLTYTNPDTLETVEISIEELLDTNLLTFDNGALVSDTATLKNIGTNVEIKIPNQINGQNVTLIDADAFKGCSNLTKFQFPTTLVRIGENAFQGTGLVNVELPEGTKILNNYAFKETRSLVNFTFPESITALGKGIFSTSGIKNVTLPDSLTTIPEAMFAQTSNLKSISLPSQLVSIGQYAFNYTGLTSVTIPKSVETIENFAFATCMYMSEFTFEEPASITTIGDTSINASALTRIEFPDSVTSLGAGLNNNSSGSIRYVKLPAGITYLPRNCFRNYIALEEILFPKQITSFGLSSFARTTSLQKIYYTGTQSQWNSISVNQDESNMQGSTYSNDLVYYYSETSQTGKYWHYVNGVPTAW